MALPFYSGLALFLCLTLPSGCGFCELDSSPGERQGEIPETTELSKVELRVMDVRDLVLGLDSEKVDIELRSCPGDSLPPMMTQGEGESRKMTCGELIARVCDETPHGDWDAPPNRIVYRQGNLIVRNRADVIDQVQVLLEGLRERR